MQSKNLLSLRGAAVGVLALIVGAGGCQSYEAKPLDLAKHAQTWRERSPGDEPVRAFAERLAASGNDSTVFDVTDGLSLGEAELVALVYNSKLRLARLRAGVARATAEHAGLWDDPELSIDVLRITESVPDPWVVSSAISFTIPISGRLEVEKQRADAAVQAELERIVEAEWLTRQQVRRAWAKWSATRLRLEETERLVAAMDSVVASAKKLAEVGEMIRTEAALLSIEQATRRSELIQMRGEAAQLEQGLRRLMGLSPTAEFRLIANVPSMEVPGDPDQRVVETNPSLARLRAEYTVAEQTLHREVRKQYPDLVIGPQYESDEGQSKIGFIGAIPIPVLNANKQGIAEAAAEREVARAAYETAYEEAIGEVAGLRTRIEAARQQRESLEQSLVPMVDRQVNDARRLVELGEVESSSGVVLLESLVRAHETKMRLIDLRQIEAMAEIDIVYLVGPDRPAPTPSPTDTPEPTDAAASDAEASP